MINKHKLKFKNRKKNKKALNPEIKEVNEEEEKINGNDTKDI